MNTSPPSRQRGIAVLWGVIFIVIGVMFTLTQVYDMVGTRAQATGKQIDSTAALFLAESGLEQGTALLTQNSAGTTFSANVCTGINNSKTLGDGTITVTGVPYPSGCDSSTDINACTQCNIQATGAIGDGSRTLERNVRIESKDGVACNGGTQTYKCSNCNDFQGNACQPSGVNPYWSLELDNPYNSKALALLHLAALPPSGSSSKANSVCYPQADCKLVWDVDSKSGNDKRVLSQLNAMNVDNPGSTDEIYAVVNKQGSNYPSVAAIGIFIPPKTGLTDYPKIGPDDRRIAYWYTPNSGSADSTIGKSSTIQTGKTNNGAASTDPTPCVTDTSAEEQTCTSWCYRDDSSGGADMLIYGVAVSGTNLLDTKVTSVTFNYHGVDDSSKKKISLTRLLHYPSTADNLVDPPTTLFSEFWYRYNPWFIYGGRASGNLQSALIDFSFEATIDTTSSPPTLTLINTALANKDCLFDGESIYEGGTVKGTIATGKGCTATGVAPATPQFDLSASTFATGGNHTLTVKRRAYTVATLNSGSYLPGQWVAESGNIVDATAGSQTRIAATRNSGTNIYLFSETTTTVTSANLYTLVSGAASSGTTVYTPLWTPPTFPAATDKDYAFVAVRYGTGLFASPLNSTIYTTDSGIKNSHPSVFNEANTHTNDFTINGTGPTTTLAGAQLCGGACALFDHQNSNTFFTLAKPNNTEYWSSGFICVSGGTDNLTRLPSYSFKPAGWREIEKK